MVRAKAKKESEARIWIGILAALSVFFARFRFQFVQQVALDAPDIDQGS